MLTSSEARMICNNRYYEIIRITQDYIELQSKLTGHCWIIQEVTFDDCRRVRLYHKHSREIEYYHMQKRNSYTVRQAHGVALKHDDWY